MFVNLILVGERYSCLLNGGLVVVDYPLIDWSVTLHRGTCGGTYPELIGLSFQHHLGMLRAT